MKLLVAVTLVGMTPEYFCIVDSLDEVPRLFRTVTRSWEVKEKFGGNMAEIKSIRLVAREDEHGIFS